MTRILVTDGLHDEALDLLRAEGWQVDVLMVPDRDQLKAMLPDYDAVIVRSSTRLDADLLQHATRLRVIGRPGVGVDNIDVEAATRRGILVMNTPGLNRIAAAEHTLALMLAVLRHIYPAARALKEHRWDRRAFIGTELAGKTVGIFGLGRIGQEVARRLRAFAVRLLACDPYVSDRVAQELGVQLVDFDTYLEACDILTLHAPLTRETRGIFNRRAFARVRPGTVLVNTARGELVDTDALLEALEQGRIVAAALDVFSQEPPAEWRLIDHPRVLATPHIGGATVEAQHKVGLEIARQIRDFLRFGQVRNAVNAPDRPGWLEPGQRAALVLGRALGQIAAGLCDFRVQKVRIRCADEVWRDPANTLVAMVTVGLLRPFLGSKVNWVNALALAEERRIQVEPEPFPSAPGDRFRVEVVIQNRGRSLTVAGTVREAEELRLVHLLGASVDVPITPYMMFVRNVDRPGVIGRIGEALARARVNIGHFALARLDTGTDAVGVLSVDSPVPDPVLAEIRAWDCIRMAVFLEIDLAPEDLRPAPS